MAFPNGRCDGWLTWPLLLLLLPVAVACGDNRDAGDPLAIEAVTPAIVDPIGGSRVVVHGVGLSTADRLEIGGVAATALEPLGDTALAARTGPLSPGSGLPVTVFRGDEQATLEGAVDAWSPAELPGARLFDAASGIGGAEVASTYEWQRLAAEIGPDWRARDGDTLSYLPATGRFWMVAGWNPYPPPDGWDDVDPSLGLPAHYTTNEVWSSADGVRWSRQLPDRHPGFDPRHSHATLYWHGRLWMVGGDWWLWRYNHDVVSSADGVHWTVEVAQTPWEDRALLVAGIFDDKLWVVGGQSLDGRPRDEFVYHNDVWSSADGVHWDQIAADAPQSATRWSGRGIVNNLVEFRGQMWLVGGGRYRDDGVPAPMFAEVWSTVDGATWTQHATPPWSGRLWADVRVWDGKLWLLFGNSGAGNLAETWYSEDGETWTALAADRTIEPGSHAQGVAVMDDYLLVAGGNYSFGSGPTIHDTDESVWRLRRFRGTAVDAWTDRGADAVTVMAAGDARPVVDPDALGPGIPGVQFDGSSSVLTLSDPEVQPDGRSVFWVGRIPWMPTPPDWDAPPVVNPLWTVVGDGDAQGCAAGLADGSLYYTSAGSATGWVSTVAGSGLQDGPGAARLLGFTHDVTGTVQAWIDGEVAGVPADGGYSIYHGWSRIGAGGYAPVATTAYPGTLGAVVILPAAIDAATVARIHAWAQGRFDVP